MTKWNPVGLAGSESFFEYVENLRQTASFGRQHVSRDGNANTDFEPMATTSDSYDESFQVTSDAGDDPDYGAALRNLDPAAFAWLEAAGIDDGLATDMERRAFMIAVGAAAATAAGAGTAAGQEDLVPDFASDLTPGPWLTGEAIVAEHRPSMSDLGYVDDDGNEVTLADDGGIVAPRDDADQPHNPVRIRADNIDSDLYTDFPRGVTRSTGDDEEEDVSALDAQEWTADNTVEDDGDALRVTGLGTATFDNFTIDSGEQRKHLQLVANVNQLQADSVVTVRVIDAAANSVEATIESGADTGDDHVIAASQGNGVVYQTQLGAMTGGQDLDEIQSVEIEIAGADAEVVFHGFDLENESEISFGRRERLDADEEIEEVTVREPTGWTGIRSMDNLDEDFGGATVEDVQYDVEFRASELPASDLEVMIEETDRHDRPVRYHLIGGFDTPSAFDLSIDLDTLYGQVRHSSSRYLKAEIETNLDEIPTMADVDDIEWTDRTADYEGGSIDDELELSSTVSSADVIGFHFDLNVEEDVADEMATTPGGGGGAAFDEGGGFLSTTIGKVTALISGVFGAVGLARFFGGE